MNLALDCEAYVASGMSEALLVYLASPRGKHDLQCAKAMHKTKAERIKEVLKAYNMAQLYGAICAAHPAANLQELCEIISAEKANLIKRGIERIIETSMSELLEHVGRGAKATTGSHDHLIRDHRPHTHHLTLRL